MKYLKLISIVFVIMMFGELNAQQLNQEKEEVQIHMIYFNYGDSVAFVWTPNSYPDLKLGAEYGYILERRIKGTTQWIQQSQPIFPLSNEGFDKLSETIEEAVTMQELIYMNDEKSEDNDFENTETGNVDDTYQEMMLDGDGDSEEEMKFNFSLISCLTHFPILKASGFYYADKSVEKTAIYEYRVVIADDTHTSSSVVEVNMSELSTLPKPMDFHADFHKKDVAFSWSVLDLSDVYASYRLERSLDGKKYVQVNDKPIVYGYADDMFENICMTKDMLVDRKTTHYYRMSGYSPFGIYGPPSDVVKGNGSPDFDVELRIDTIAVNKKNEATIKWSVDSESEKQIKGFVIEKSSSMKEDYLVVTKSLLSSKKREYVDKTTMRTNYYRVRAIGHNEGEIVSSFPYFAFQIDSIPPAPPTGLKGVVDSLGIVTLKWESNKEDDIFAYRVFVSNDNKLNSFVAASDSFLLSPLFLDTLPLNTLTNEIYYKVVALDFNYNHSKMSAPIKLMKPDTIPPAKSIIMNVQALDNRIKIDWENSTSTDVARISLFRQIADTSKIALIKEWNIQQKTTSFEDFYSSKTEKIRYYLRTYDLVGNMSEDISFWIEPQNTSVFCVKNFKAVPMHDKAKIQLTWEQDDCRIEKIHLYRKVNDRKITLLTTLNGAQRFYEDKKIRSGEKYQYILRPIAKQSIKSVYSEKIEF